MENEHRHIHKSSEDFSQENLSAKSENRRKKYHLNKIENYFGFALLVIVIYYFIASSEIRERVTLGLASSTLVYLIIIVAVWVIGIVWYIVRKRKLPNSYTTKAISKELEETLDERTERLKRERYN